MKEWQKITPKYPTGKAGSFVVSTRKDNPIKINLFINPKEEKSLHAKIYLQEECEGPPQHVHGGCQAAILDELMGSCAWQNDYPVVAAKIEVEFLTMLPSKTEVYGFAKIYKIDDRKVYVEANIYLKDTIYSKSKGIFMILSEKKIEELKKLLSN